MRKKYVVEGYGVVGKKEAAAIMKRSHITVVRDVTGYDMRKVSEGETLPGRNVYRGEI